MKITKIAQIGTWAQALTAARNIIGKPATDKEPSQEWKVQILLAEHSPIRIVQFMWTWEDLPSRVSDQFTQHKGIKHFVQSQRADRSVTLPVTHSCIANAQALISISRKRRCSRASAETRNAWSLLLEALESIDPVVASLCVPECIYRGFCPEIRSCGFTTLPIYPITLAGYRKHAK
jgi:hypothetical protein